MVEMSKVQLNYCLCVKEAKNYVSLHLIAGSNTGGFVQYFKISPIRSHSEHSGSSAIADSGEYSGCKGPPLLCELSKCSERL